MKRKKVLLFLCVLIGLSSVSNATTLLTSWSWNDGTNLHTYTAYGYNGESKAWDDVVLPIPGSHLATITSQQEQDELNDALTTARLGGEYWLGGYQVPNTGEPKGLWEWITGETWSFEAWHPGEPNNLNTEQHLAVWQDDWKWNDEGNLDNIYGFIIETTSPIPEPATMLLFGLGIIGLARIGKKKIKE